MQTYSEASPAPEPRCSFQFLEASVRVLTRCYLPAESVAVHARFPDPRSSVLVHRPGVFAGTAPGIGLVCEFHAGTLTRTSPLWTVVPIPEAPTDPVASCRWCYGSGIDEGDPCGVCSGTGLVPADSPYADLPVVRSAEAGRPCPCPPEFHPERAVPDPAGHVHFAGGTGWRCPDCPFVDESPGAGEHPDDPMRLDRLG